jgi:hypothetical protein
VPASVFPILVWARSARRKRILTRAVAFGTSVRTETGRECPLPFPLGLGALSAPKTNTEHGRWLSGRRRGRKQVVSARFRFPHSWLRSVSFCLGALSGPRYIMRMHLIVCAALVGVLHGFLLHVVLCK